MKTDRIIILCLSAIGNTILFTPTLRVLRKKFPKSRIDMLVRESSFAEVLKGSNFIDNIYVIKEGKCIFDKVRLFLKLRKNKYNISINAFPSNRLGFNAAAFLAGAKTRITHSYNNSRLKTLSFLQNKKIKANPNIHDVEQNFNFLKLLGIDINKEKRQLIFHISGKDREFANNFFKKNKIKKPVVALQPGASVLAPYREWPKENFIKLADMLIEKLKAIVIVFEGPDEPGIADEIISNMKNKGKAVAVNTSLKKAAVIIEKCNLLISTDSGLGHVAAARNTKAIALFGPANPVRTRPYGKMHKVIMKDVGCSPCIRYPFESTDSHTKCKTLECLKAITPEEVLEEAKRMI